MNIHIDEENIVLDHGVSGDRALRIPSGEGKYHRKILVSNH